MFFIICFHNLVVRASVEYFRGLGSSLVWIHVFSVGECSVGLELVALLNIIVNNFLVRPFSAKSHDINFKKDPEKISYAHIIMNTIQ